jgi:hypothetical protein
VEVLAVRGGEAWGTLMVELIGDVEPVERLMESLPRQLTTQEPSRVPVAPGVTRTDWHDVHWNLTVLPVAGTDRLGYAYVETSEHAPPAELVAELIRRFPVGPAR